jgi:hypothetical protein
VKNEAPKVASETAASELNKENQQAPEIPVA